MAAEKMWGTLESWLNSDTDTENTESYLLMRDEELSLFVDEELSLFVHELELYAGIRCTDTGMKNCPYCCCWGDGVCTQCDNIVDRGTICVCMRVDSAIPNSSI